MKQIAVVTTLLLIFAFSANVVHPYTPPLGGRLWQIKEMIASQIERVKMAREQAENHMTLSRYRIAEQLQMSEERLSMQLEKLKMYEEILKEQLDESGSAIASARSDWDSLVDSVASDLESQISRTDRLIRQMQKIRYHVGDESHSVIPSFTLSSPGLASTPPTQCPDDPIRNLRALQNLQGELDDIAASISSYVPPNPPPPAPMTTFAPGG